MIRAEIILPLGYDFNEIIKRLAEVLKIDPVLINDPKPVKKTIDLKDENNITLKMTFEIALDRELEEYLIKRSKAVTRSDISEFKAEKKSLKKRPVVVGFGPAGIFAALILAEAGTDPIVLERGEAAECRIESVKRFYKTGILNTESNIQFGEGGAGTFSDGKLKPGKIDCYKLKVLKEFVKAGAPEEILYDAYPHIGTDKLIHVVQNIRKRIISLGGEVYFSSKLTDIKCGGGRITAVKYRHDNADYEYESNDVVMATGHSARDIFEMLNKKGIKSEAKGFGVGMRVEHPSKLINAIKFGKNAGNPDLGTASYKLVTHLKNGRNVYSFCMCPGGRVEAAASEEYSLVTNGSSKYLRGGINSNSALLVTVNKGDFGSDDPLAGIEFQRRLERAAFSAGKGGYKAPVQRMEDFLAGRRTVSFGSVLPTYPRGTEFAEAGEYLPDYITDSLRQAIVEFEEWMPGFYMPDSILTGTETRTTSPVRILRDIGYEAEGIKGLYPCGEGAGYAGGIISAAVDGVKCAEMLLTNSGRLSC